MFMCSHDRILVYCCVVLVFVVYSCDENLPVRDSQDSRIPRGLDVGRSQGSFSPTSLRVRTDGATKIVRSKSVQLQCCFDKDTITLICSGDTLYNTVVSTDHHLGWSDEIKIKNSLDSFVISVNSYRSSVFWPRGYSLCYVNTDSSVLNLDFTNTIRLFR